jgi:hypothetical protein
MGILDGSNFTSIDPSLLWLYNIFYKKIECLLKIYYFISFSNKYSIQKSSISLLCLLWPGIHVVS